MLDLRLQSFARRCCRRWCQLGGLFDQAIALALALALVLTVAACEAPVEHFLGLPIPLTYSDGLLYAYGEARTTRDGRCGITPDDNDSDAPGSPRLLLDLASPLTVLSDSAGRPAQPFSHGQVQLNAANPDGSEGAARFLLCDLPLIRGNQPFADFRLERQVPGQTLASSGPLGAVLGGDIFSDFSLQLSFVDSALSKPQLLIRHSDITPSCFVEGAVLPYQAAGGQLLAQVGDSVLHYNPTRVTLSACVEPLADPLVDPQSPGSAQSCIDPLQLSLSIPDLQSQLTAAQQRQPVDQAQVARLAAWKQIVSDLATLSCADITDLPTLGDVVDAAGLRRPAYEASGVNMRFLLSTGVPDLLLSQNACSRLASPERCSCADADKVTLRLPGLNGPQPDGTVSLEQGCRIKLGGGGKAALALIARQLTLSPCAELARSRRQRYAPPQLPAEQQTSADCLREACLQNLSRQNSLTAQRCGYTGLDIGKACDDHQAPAAAYVELGGPNPDKSQPDDTIDALVLPDTARIFQSTSDDIRNVSPQVDGVLGVSLLRRLTTVVDYPQSRVVLGCRCPSDPSAVCRTYQGASYHSADSCVPSDPLVIPPHYGLSSSCPAAP